MIDAEDDLSAISFVDEDYDYRDDGADDDDYDNQVKSINEERTQKITDSFKPDYQDETQYFSNDIGVPDMCYNDDRLYEDDNEHPPILVLPSPPSHNLSSFLDILWKQMPWMGFCTNDQQKQHDQEERDENATYATNTTACSSKHRRNEKIVIFENAIPPNIITKFKASEDIPSPLVSPTEKFTTPLQENMHCKTPPKPLKSKSAQRIAPKLNRDKFQFPSFRSDRAVSRALFEEGKNFDNEQLSNRCRRRSSKRSREQSSDDTSFQGWCIVYSNSSNQSGTTVLSFVKVFVNHNLIKFYEDNIQSSVQEQICIDQSFKIFTTCVNKKYGHGVILDWDGGNKTKCIIPLDLAIDCINPSTSILEGFRQPASTSTGEWGTVEYLEENFASITAHERLLNLYFVVDLMRFKNSDFYS